MKRMQNWFEIIAGISQEERERYALAQEIYGNKGQDISALQKPACWRRKSRIRIQGNH